MEPTKELRVDLRAMKDKSNEVEQFLRSKLQERIVTGEPQIMIGGENAKEVKRLLNKFLRYKNLIHLQVLSTADGLAVVPTRKGSDEKQFARVIAIASETTPEYFPGLSMFAASCFKTPHYYFGKKETSEVGKPKPKPSTFRK